MIKFIPKRETVSLSLKEEIAFCSVKELIEYIVDKCSKMIRYIGRDNYIEADSVIISNNLGYDMITGLNNVHNISVNYNGKIYLVGCYGE